MTPVSEQVEAAATVRQQMHLRRTPLPASSGLLQNTHDTESAPRLKRPHSFSALYTQGQGFSSRCRSVSWDFPFICVLQKNKHRFVESIPSVVSEGNVPQGTDKARTVYTAVWSFTRQRVLDLVFVLLSCLLS